MLRVATACISLLIVGSALAAEPVFPPGSRIGLVPPDSMQLTRGISGFFDPKTGAAIVLVEMPAEAYPAMAAGFTEESLKGQGFSLKTRDTVKIAGADAILIQGDQKDGERQIPKTVLLAPEQGLTALVIAQLPQGSPAPEIARVREALQTVAIRPALTMDQQVAALPFRLGDTAGFRPLRVMAGNSVLLTDGPSDVVKGADQPIMIVAQSYAPAPPPDARDSFARQALGANMLLKDTVYERSQGFRQGGADWHEIVAKAKDGPSEEPVVILQTIRFGPDGYLRMVGIVRENQRDAVMPRFRKMVDSVGTR